MTHKFIIWLVALFVAIPLNGRAQTISDYLILDDIGDYKLSKPAKSLPGFKPIGGPRTYDGAGVISSTGHFDDHKDTSYKVMYLGGDVLPSPTVIVVQHAGADSDKWLLHEVERDFRNYYGIPGDSYAMRQVNGNTIMVAMSGGGAYRWVSGNKVIQIEYTDLQLSKPEPLEVIQAYLVKHPSSLPETTSEDLRTDTNKTAWIKDEMERRLWLCYKWFMQLQLGKAEQAEVLKESVEHMEVFLEYREKYYGISGEEEKDLLDTYLGQKSGTGIRNRLEALKQWWDDNRENPINL